MWRGSSNGKILDCGSKYASSILVSRPKICERFRRTNSFVRLLEWRKMTLVKIKKNIIKINGHCGYAPVGNDIVCAAMSTLVQTFIWSIEELTNDEITYNIKSGYALVKHGTLSELGHVLKESFLIGINGVASAYPDYVKINSLDGVGLK